MIELRNVFKSYPVKSGVKHVLRDVSLTIPSDTNLAVLGPNGAGKSTLLRLIGGSEPPNSGQIIRHRSVSWPLGLATGFQSSLSGRQNVLFVCGINGLNRSQTRQVIDEVTEFTELGIYFDQPVNTYSSGMRARLSFGLSMAFLFDIYLVDELTSVGDAVFREKAKKAFKELKGRASIIFVSHNLESLRESCDSALFLHDGNAVFYPKIKDGLQAYQEYIFSDRLSHAKEIHALRKAKRAMIDRKNKKKKASAGDPQAAPGGEDPGV